MFEDDPEMQAMVKKGQVEVEPVEKPWWFQLVTVVGLLIGAGLMLLVGVLFFNLLDYYAWVFGGAAGGVASLAALGWTAGRYENFMSGQKFTLWKPIRPLHRLLMIPGTFALLGLGVAVTWYDAGQLAEKRAAQEKSSTPPAGTKPPVAAPAGKPKK